MRVVVPSAYSQIKCSPSRYRLTTIAPAKHAKVQYAFSHDPGGRAGTIFPLANGKYHHALGVIAGETTAQVRAHVVNDAVAGHDDAVTALFYPFDVTDLAANALPQAANIPETSASGSVHSRRIGSGKWV